MLVKRSLMLKIFKKIGIDNSVFRELIRDYLEIFLKKNFLKLIRFFECLGKKVIIVNSYYLSLMGKK